MANNHANSLATILRNFRIYSDHLRSELTFVVLDSTTKIEEKYKRNVAVDDSNIKQSIYHKMNYQKAIGTVGATAFHAPFIEFGTGGKVEVPSGFEDFAMTFYVNGKGNMAARPALIPAFLEESENLKRETENVVSKYSGLKSIKRL